MKKFLLFASAVALFASCSKDLTEDVAPVVGKGKIVASYDESSDTRTHMVDRKKFEWDAGDALGVFNAIKNDDANIPFTFTGVNGIFTGDLEFFKSDSYYAYYPWADGQALDGVSSVKGMTAGFLKKLHISASQNFTFKYDDTFAANAVPAVAYGTADADGQLVLNFKPVVSYISVPLVGYGTVESLSLEIKNASTDAATNLAGDITVDMSKLVGLDSGEPFPVASIDNTALDGEKITLKCGKGVELDQDEITYFWFVIPANTEFGGQKFVITVNGTKELTYTFPATVKTYKTTPNMYEPLWDGVKDKPFEYIDGDVYIINNEFEYMLYAYAMNHAGAPAGLGMTADGALKNAVITANLDFAPEKFNPEEVDILKYDDDALAYVRQAIKAYNEGGVEFINLATAKSTLTGAVKDAETGVTGPATIANLPVSGYIWKQGTLKDIAFKNVTVTSDATDAYYFTATAPTATTTTYFNNVTVEGGVLVAANAENVAVFNTAAMGTATTDAMYEAFGGFEVTCGEKAVAYANTLTTSATNTLSKGVITLSKNFVNSENIAFNKINVTGAGAVAYVADEATAKAFIALIPAQGTSKNWCSVVTYTEDEEDGITVDTSYWTGWIPGAMPTAAKQTDEVFSAEELAYLVANQMWNWADSGTDVYVNLTNNIDLMGDVTVDSNGIANASGNGKNWADVLVKAQSSKTNTLGLDGAIDEDTNYTISNVYIKPAADSGVKHVSLFARRAHAKNLNIEKVYINGKLLENANVAGLSMTTGYGGYNNVHITDMDIHANPGTVVGGFVKTLTATASTNVSFKGRITSDTTKDAPIRGAIAGELTFDAEKISSMVFTNMNFELAGKTSTNYMSVFGQVNVNVQPGENTIDITFWESDFVTAPAAYVCTNEAATKADKTTVKFNVYPYAEGNSGSATVADTVVVTGEK